MANIQVDNLAKLNILKSAYSNIISTFATICYQIGVDPFSIDIHTYVVPEDDSLYFGGSMARQLEALRTIHDQISELESQL